MVILTGNSLRRKRETRIRCGNLFLIKNSHLYKKCTHKNIHRQLDTLWFTEDTINVSKQKKCTHKRDGRNAIKKKDVLRCFGLVTVATFAIDALSK